MGRDNPTNKEDAVGLDISYYRNLVPTEHASNDDDALRPIVHPEFPGRTDGLDPNRWYIGEQVGDFRVGSHSGYNLWRDELARSVHGKSASDLWEAGESDGPFMELINFSDCEGTIGPVVSAKLDKDFADWRERVAASGVDAYFMSRYDAWHEAFAVAAENGAVDFH